MGKEDILIEEVEVIESSATEATEVAEAAAEALDSAASIEPKPKKTRTAWECTVCGYIETRFPDGLPADYRCPICNAKPKKFRRIEIEV